ncbi:MAG: type II toxin-antitoxin system RelE/ParE family toxin [Thiobacillaceae bacterium]|nr:type II toxin-antitoxin system RelE/ParE family toxin [Thiobacillaceae bacterium]
MGSKARTPVRLTTNFETNLDDIERFLSEAGAPAAYDRLLDQLLEVVVPNLQRFPRAGRPFLARVPDSAEAVLALHRLRERLGEMAEIREYLTRDYLILYALLNGAVYLLSIRHHRQLSFDLARFWSDAPSEDAAKEGGHESE